MRRHSRWLVAAVVAAVFVAVTAAGVVAANAESNGGVRVMPLGDSITEGTQVPGGSRIGLWQRFTAAGYRVDFVGSQSNGPASLGDHDHEGHPGWRIDQIDASIMGWLRSYTPQTVLLHIGTNDVLQNHDVASAPNRLSTLLDHIVTTAPTADVFVAQIIPLANTSQESAVRVFNAAIPGIVQAKVNAGKHVHLVDMHSALSTADLIDGIHPTAAGYDKMAARWYSALLSVSGSIGSPGGPSPTRTTTPPTPTRTSTPPASTPPPAGGRTCTAAYAVTGQWSGGFQASIRVTAGGSAIAGWTVTWRFGNGQTVTQGWNATITGSGPAITASSVSYNGVLAAAATAEFGFLGTWTTTNETPTLTCSAA